MDDKEHYWNDFHSPEMKRDRAILRDLVLRVYGIIGFACLVFLVMLAATWSTNANALPIFQAEADGIRIVLTDEDCKLTAVENLKKRATWTEKGKTFEGCYGIHPLFPIVMAYFADKTVVVFPNEVFQRVSGA